MWMSVGAFQCQYFLANKLYIWLDKFARDTKLGQKMRGYCVSIGYSHCGIYQVGLFEKKKNHLNGGVLIQQ